MGVLEQFIHVYLLLNVTQHTVRPQSLCSPLNLNKFQQCHARFKGYALPNRQTDVPLHNLNNAIHVLAAENLMGSRITQHHLI